MNKRFLFALTIALSLGGAAFAQPGGGGFQRMTVEERVARIHNKLDSAFKLGPEIFKVLDTALTVLYKQQDAKRQELMAGGPGSVDRETMQAEMKLGLDVLRPWDVEAEPAGTAPLRPFKSGTELTDKTIACFNKLQPFFADCISRMKEMGHLDLESRKGKAPGGYNCPLAESGAPFIFMNAAGTLDDVTTMVHEGGHAIHSFLAHELELTGFKEYPTEIAEVASMSMELFSMDHWNTFFATADELKRAKEQQLERVITIFPWIATIDKFQHWVYENPGHTTEERAAQWMRILEEFSSPVIDFTGLDDYRQYGWQRQLHLYEVPFYYIEYGIAQLGAIGLWQQYKQNPETAVSHYINALQLGGTRSLPELFEAAGLKFDFSPAHIRTLMDFVKTELEQGH